MVLVNPMDQPPWERENENQPDVSDSTVRILNFLSTSYDFNDDDSLEFEIRRLLLNEKILCRSGYFYRTESDLILPPRYSEGRIGSFLIRYSRNPSYLYTLTRKDGTHTISHYRIYYQRGWFTLYEDFEQAMDLNHGFETVTDLIEYYQRFPMNHGLYPFILPYRYKLPSLKHLCLRRIARRLRNYPGVFSMADVKYLGLPRSLTEEVKENAFPLECLRERMNSGY